MFEAWLADVFTHPDPLGAVVITAKTAVIYVFLIFGLRIIGKRELGQMTIYDLVLIIVLANSVQNAMVGKDTTLAGGLVAALTLLILNRLFTIILAHSSALELAMVGAPLVIVEDGHLLPEQMKKEGVTPKLVYAAMREHGIGTLSDVRLAVLEVDGSISIVPKEALVHRTHRHFRALRIE